MTQSLPMSQQEDDVEEFVTEKENISPISPSGDTEQPILEGEHHEIEQSFECSNPFSESSKNIIPEEEFYDEDLYEFFKTSDSEFLIIVSSLNIHYRFHEKRYTYMYMNLYLKEWNTAKQNLFYI